MKTFMQTYGAVYWTIWFYLALPITFAIPETMALKWGGLTLSSYTDLLFAKWPLMIFLQGALVGGLAVHLLWHWAGPGNAGG
jgi:hypothetical protein